MPCASQRSVLIGIVFSDAFICQVSISPDVAGQRQAPLRHL